VCTQNAFKTFFTATLRWITLVQRSFAIIFNVVGQTAALQGNAAGLNAGVLSLFFRPNLIRPVPSKTDSLRYKTVQGVTLEWWQVRLQHFLCPQMALE
jgi:hypothetical protein